MIILGSQTKCRLDSIQFFFFCNFKKSKFVSYLSDPSSKPHWLTGSNSLIHIFTDFLLKSFLHFHRCSSGLGRAGLHFLQLSHLTKDLGLGDTGPSLPAVPEGRRRPHSVVWNQPDKFSCSLGSQVPPIASAMRPPRSQAG